jgi:hypothetical protein
MENSNIGFLPLFKVFWTPAFAGVTALLSFARGSMEKQIRPKRPSAQYFNQSLFPSSCAVKQWCRIVEGSFNAGGTRPKAWRISKSILLDRAEESAEFAFDRMWRFD